MNHVSYNPSSRLSVAVLFVCLTHSAFARPATEEQRTYETVKLAVERLPDLHVPRAGHSRFYAGGELVVVGGHTTGFVPTATAEYYSNGEWKLLPTVYAHDDGFSVVLRSGKVLIAGGHSEPLGIGQTFMATMYDPNNHTFTGFGCLDQKRTLANATEIDSGKVVISGNWYANDKIEVFDGKKKFAFLKDVASNRSIPYILRTDKDEVVIFSAYDERGKKLDSIMVDRLHGEAFREPLLETWRPIGFDHDHRSEEGAIGDESVGEKSYLITAFDSLGQMAIIKVLGLPRNRASIPAIFSLLPTELPIPMVSPIGGERIRYQSSVVADKQLRRGYIVGMGENEHRLYVLCVEYGKNVEGKGCPLTLYYTEPMLEVGNTIPLLTPDGNLLIAGGIWDDNFTPFSSVWLLHVAPDSVPSHRWNSMIHWFLWGCLFVIILVVAVVVLLRRHHRITDTDIDSDEPETLPDEEPDEARGSDSALMERIHTLMEEQKMYLNAGLKISDVAVGLDTNSRYVSHAINSCEGCSFSQFVNNYRIEYAKQLMRAEPEKKMSAVSVESGFTNEKSFFRTFKTLTGMAPKEWMAQSEEQTPKV